MKNSLDKNWWKTIFDEVYLLTDARSVCNEDLSRQEVDFLEDQVLTNKSGAILDLCGGQGRHALELSRRGFKDVTVLDYSQYLVDLGRKRAKTEGLNTQFVQGDARNTGLPSKRYVFVIIMASSFGYLPDESENLKILQEAFRLLGPEGTLLMDLPNKDYILKNFKSESSHRVNEELTAIRRRELGEDIIYSKETVISKTAGKIRENIYCTRLYSADKISALLAEAGFVSVTCQKNFMNRGDGNDYGVMNNRMIVLAKVP